MDLVDEDLAKKVAMFQLKLLEKDDEWDSLRAKILDERKQKNLSITDFLVSCGLNSKTPYFKQLCCKAPHRSFPSNRENTRGREFRDAVTNYFAEGVAPTHSMQLSIGTAISEWCLDNYVQLQNSGILCIRLVAQDSNSANLAVYVLDCCNLSDGDIENWLTSDAHVNSSLAGSVLKITSRCDALLPIDL